jgi:hypothetical protein
VRLPGLVERLETWEIHIRASSRIALNPHFYFIEAGRRGERAIFPGVRIGCWGVHPKRCSRRTRRRPSGTPVLFFFRFFPALKRWANNHCAYGAGGGLTYTAPTARGGAVPMGLRMNCWLRQHPCAYGAGRLAFVLLAARGFVVSHLRRDETAPKVGHPAWEALAALSGGSGVRVYPLPGERVRAERAEAGNLKPEKKWPGKRRMGGSGC